MDGCGSRLMASSFPFYPVLPIFGCTGSETAISCSISRKNAMDSLHYDSGKNKKHNLV